VNVDLEKSIKAKLRAIAKEKNCDPADLWQTLMLERFLARLGQSIYRNHFILKGGVLLSKYIEIGRETRDLDFLARKINHEIENLEVIFKTIAALDLEDGFSFKELQISQLVHPHMRYTGAEVAMMAYFGKVRSKVNIDIGFGDVVRPIQKIIPFIHHSKGALFESETLLFCYPKESIFAEKLETIVHRGALNSRMKDFHDLHSLISAPEPFAFTNLKNVIQAVFKRRQTPLTIPILFEDEALVSLQRLWNNYLKGLRIQEAEKLPLTVAQVLQRLNEWLQAHHP